MEEVDSEIRVILNFNNFEYLEKLLCKNHYQNKRKEKFKCISWLGNNGYFL